MKTTLNFTDNDLNTKVKSALTRLTLVNFRNYKYLRLNLEKPFIVLGGENGSGKTNVLEAISFLSQGRGLRNAKLSEVKTFDFLSNQQNTPTFINNNGWAVSALVKRDEDEFSIGTAVETQVKEIEYNEVKEVERRVVQVNNQKLASQNELGNYVSMIWVVPQMDRLFIGGAQHRRSFLDRIVCAFDTDHTKRLSQFDNLYRQWLQLLKNGTSNNNWLKALEEKLAGLNVAIAAARKEQLYKLINFMSENPDDIFPDIVMELDGTIEKMLDEKPAIDVEDFYCESMKKLRHTFLSGEGSFGINKTDLKVIYKRKNVPANLCSTGEQKSLLLSIILSEARCLNHFKGFPPILLLDEVAAHLDENKFSALLKKLFELHTQVWLTTTNPAEFDVLAGVAQFFEVKDNNVHELS